MPGKIYTVLALEIEYHGPAELKGVKGQHSASFTLRTTDLEQEQEQEQEHEQEEQEGRHHCCRLLDAAVPRRPRQSAPGGSYPTVQVVPAIEERDGCPDEEVRLSSAFLSELIDTAERRQRLNDVTPTPKPEKFTKTRWR